MDYTDSPGRPKAGPLRAAGRFLRDERDRAVILHGVNLSGRHKQPPHVLPPEPAYLDPLCAWGVNVARLVLPWEAIEPEPGRFDDAYLDRVAALAEALCARGIHVIADMHQDIYSRALGGSGAPAWAVAPQDLAAEQPPGAWFLRYGLSAPVRRSLARFFRDEDGLQGHFIGALCRAAARLRGLPGVIGCELLNEPFPGELPFDRFEPDYLQPFYLRALRAVRQVAPDWLIFFEGALLQSEGGTALDLRQGGDGAGLVYIPHFYDKQVFVSGGYDGESAEMRRVLAVYAADAARLGCPVMLGEYGIMPEARGAYEYLRDQERALEGQMMGGTVWHYNPTAEDWNDERMSLVLPGTGPGPTPPLETDLVRAFSRPYPMAVAGEPLAYGFDDERGAFTLRYRAAPAQDGGDGETVVFLPHRPQRRSQGAAPRIQVQGGAAQLVGHHLIIRARGPAEVMVQVELGG
jgi:endoglycosylceramidase